MQNEQEELDQIVDIYFDKLEATAFFDKIQYHFDKIISKTLRGLVESGHPETELIKVVAVYYSENIHNMIEYCKDFISFTFEDGVRIPLRSLLNLFDTVQVDLVAMNEDNRTEFPEVELVNPQIEPELKTIILEMALRIIDTDIHNLSHVFNEKVQDAIIMEMERRKMEEEGLL